MVQQRFDFLDALRGVAIVWMTAFHFAFDLNQFGYSAQNFYKDPFWTTQRSAIVTLFVFCAGLGQAVAVAQGQGTARFYKRWLQVAACALLVTAGSYWMYPKSFIYFGVLHGMAVMLLVVRFTANWGGWLWPAGGAVLLAGALAGAVHSHWPQLAVFNQPGLNWLGLISKKPITEDYVPLLPWLGVMWWGMAAGQWLLVRKGALLMQTLPRAATPLAWLGRWSLSWYMLHQPVLIGLLMAVAALRP